jgi:hypothetical protein
MFTWNGCTFSLWYLQYIALVTGRQAGTVRSSTSMDLGGLQKNPGTFRTCSAVLCIEFLFFIELKKNKKERSKQERK